MNQAAVIAYSLLETLALQGAAQDKEADPASPDYLLWMCHQIINNPSWDEGKANRWLGYIQGVLVAIGASTLQTERDRVRGVIRRFN